MLFALYCSFPIVNAQTETVRFKYIGIDKGLSQNSVMDIVQDHKGFLWIATRDGLNRYNGYEIKVYRSSYEDSSSLFSNILKKLFIDSKGRLWIASERGGLTLYNEETDNFKLFLNDQAQTISSNIVEDNNGNLWFTVDRKGIVKFNTEDFSHKYIPIENLNISRNIFSRVSIINGLLWIGMRDLGIKIYNINNDKFVDEKHLFPNINSIDQQVREIKQDVFGNIFIGTINGIYYLNRNHNKFKFLEIDGFESRGSLINTILCTDSILWFSSHDRGLFKYNLKDKSLNIYKDNANSKYALSYPLVTSIYQDNQNILWIGTFGGGLNKMSSRLPFKLFTHDENDPNSLSHNSSRDIIKDNQGQLIVASYDGVKVFNDSISYNLPYKYEVEPHNINKNQLLSNSIYSLDIDKTDLLWIGHEGNGIQSYNFKTKRFQNYMLESKNPLLYKENYINVIKATKKGNVYAGTMEGLFIKKTNQNSFVKLALSQNPEIDNSPQIHDIFENLNGALFIATDNGMYYLYNDVIKHINCEIYRTKISGVCESKSKMKCINALNDSTILIGTSGSGILKLKYSIENNELIVNDLFTIDNQVIKRQTVYGILNENDSTIWFSSNTGLYRYNIFNNEIYNFTYSDGLQENEFNSASYYKDSKGVMYFGGINGINAFDPEKIKLEKHETKLYINSVQFGDSIIPNFFNTQIKKLHINYGKTPLSVDFFGLNLDRPDNTNYFVQLVDLDSKPRFIGKQREVNYFNLSPGEYELRLWTGNLNTYNPSKDYQSLSFYIIPPFYLTKLFIASVIVIICLLIYSFVKQRMKHLTKERDRLEKEVQMRQTIIENQKLENEINTSKAVISGQNIEQKRISVELHDGLGHILTLVSLNISTILNHVKNLEWDIINLKLEELKSLQNQAITELRNISNNLMPNLIIEEGIEEAINEFCIRLERNSNINISFYCERIPQNIDTEKVIAIYRMTQEIMNNSVKHAQADKLSIKLLIENNILHLKIKDNGIGFDISTIKNKKGRGLKNIQARTNLHHGELHISSKKEVGTEIHISMPL